MEPTVKNCFNKDLNILLNEGSIQNYNVDYYDFGPEFGWGHDLEITFNNGKKLKFYLKNSRIEFQK